MVSDEKVLKMINKPATGRYKRVIGYIIALFVGYCIGVARGQSKEDILSYVKDVNRWYNVPSYIIPAIIQIESDFDQSAVSYKDAYGVMQVTRPAYEDYIKANPKTHQSWISNFDVVKNDYKANIAVGSWYLVKRCYRKHRNWIRAITAYNYGPWNDDYTFGYYNRYLATVKKNENLSKM